MITVNYQEHILYMHWTRLISPVKVPRKGALYQVIILIVQMSRHSIDITYYKHRYNLRF